MDSMYLDNLDESVNDERKIVTYKWLSLTVGVHTNVAKQMLYQFVQKQRRKDCHDLTVTYIVSGVVAGQAGQPDTVKVAVVPEDALAAVKSEMKEVVSVHVYSVQRVRLNDLSLLYSSHYDTVKEHINDINKYSGIKCTSAGLRSSADLEKLKKGSAYQPPVEPPRPESKYKPQVKKEPLAQDNKPVQSVNKVGSKTSGGKNNQIASMFAQQAKKVVKKEKSEDKDESAKPKEETKSQAKNKRDISSFLSKGPSTKKQQPVKETKVESASSCPKKTNASPRKSPARDSVKEDIIEVEVEEKEVKMQVDSPVKKQQKQSKIKAKKTNQTNKRKKEAEDESKTKRKRIMQLSDSESSDDEEEDAEAAKWAALSPTPPASSPPATLDTARIESDSEEEIPPTPQEDKNGRARKRKLVNKTFTDEDGYLVTKKEYEYVDDSGEEDAADTTTTTTTSESPGVSQSSSTSATKTSPKKTPVSPQKKTKDSPKKKTGAKSSKKSHAQDTKKQSKIMSFFSKK
ncbi:hypothetical protein Pcinc_033530 [Petrolisthes cinctipes]|uniref:DNA polymerase delta subunit 3 n=1 Tax=Petrolisthes cinctipes TaxID=88211 RepID=A0AAE1K177_PETCI|nr:hypothetical protein Pcinc_033530 [Petrolisthes cinctipes]